MYKDVFHSLGLTHDGDETTGNSCKEEGSRGSVMAPMVAATFHHFYWSSCSKKEFHRRVRWENHFSRMEYFVTWFIVKVSISRRWSCLLNKPTYDSSTPLKASIRDTFTMDEQCRVEFGEGYVFLVKLPQDGQIMYILIVWYAKDNIETFKCIL